MKICSVCGRKLAGNFYLCKSCEKYSNEEWTKELVRIERHNSYMQIAHEETSFSDLEEKDKEFLGLED